jgi:hypothetical protein
MLAIADADGIVSASVPGLASVSNVSVESTRTAVKNLLSEDPDSRTKDFEGRRIEEIDGGWRILNYLKYRRMLNDEERKEYKAKWIADKRRQVSTPRRLKSTLSTHAEAEAEAIKKRGANGSPQRRFNPIGTVDDWLKELQQDKTYQGIDVQREYGKMLAWCGVNKKEATRRRFVNWLNRAERPLPAARSVSYKRNHSPPPREVTEAELAAQRKIVRECSEKLRSELNR